MITFTPSFSFVYNLAWLQIGHFENFAQDIQDTEYDWIRCRKALGGGEPTVSIGTEQVNC
jgi:hypothetical protein